GGGTRSGLGRSISVSSAQATLPFSRSIRARTRSPGAARGTKVARPSLALAADGVAAHGQAVDLDGHLARLAPGLGHRLRERLRRAAAGEVEVEVAGQRAADRHRGGRRRPRLDGVDELRIAEADVEGGAQAI